MAVNKLLIRKLHRVLAPIMIAPIVLTLITGSLYQIAVLTGRTGDFYWLIRLHRGDWIVINLEMIYPFLNALGLLIMASTGISLWLQTRRRPRSPQPEPPLEI